MTSSATVISPTFFGAMIQGEWIADDGSLYQPVSKYFGLLRLWDSRAVWGKMMREDGSYDWSALEANIRYAQHVGAEVMFTFGEPPVCECDAGVKRPTPNGWARFVESIVTQAAGRVKYWELWNEPGIPGYWDGTPEELAMQSQAGYSIIKRLQPDAIVLSPSLTEMALPRGKLFIGRYLAAKGGESCDVVAFHGYCARPEDIVPDIGFLRETLAWYGVDRALWNTEYVVGPVTPPLRPAYMAQSLIIQASLGIQGAVWDSEISGSEDYLDPTTGRVAAWLLDNPVGALQRDGEIRYVSLGKLELWWTEQSYPVLSAGRHSAPGSTRKGCNLLRFLRR